MKKKLLLLMILMVTISVTLNTISVSATTEYEKNEADVTRVANQAEYIYTEAFEFNSDGSLKAIDFKKIQDKYGYDDELARFQREWTNAMMYRSTANPSCMLAELGKAYGVNTMAGVSLASFKVMLKETSWRAVANKLISSLGGFASIVSITATLATASVNCGASTGGSYDCSVNPAFSQFGCKP